MNYVFGKTYEMALVTCCHCGNVSGEDLEIIFASDRDNASLTCVACKKEFYVELTCQTRDAEHRRAVDPAAATEACILKDRHEELMYSLEYTYCPACGRLLSQTAAGN